MSKPFKLLIEDHNKVKTLIKDMLASSSKDKAKRKEMLAQLKQELKLHEKIEEKYVYPPMEEKKATHDMTLEAYQEHHVVDVLLGELGHVDVSDEDWKAKLTVLEENLTHHIKEEETELFVKAQKNLSSDVLNQMEKDIAEAKR
ncbi:MAG: hemerythrin [Burkholderiales bacterium]|jgi:hemerythrin superfamily protein|nr:hemerythrin [Burkholderiales bacterium]